MMAFGGVTYINSQRKIQVKNVDQIHADKYMSDRNRKVLSYLRRFTDTVTEEVIKSLSNAFQDRREKEKPHVDLHKIGFQRPY